ncbi:MAG TPA: zf-HC2 domain-containing protein [Longimicrobiales bacterium]|nr:zf-HC2 domain-containing protein [Longimicrobiales bacterium]
MTTMGCQQALQRLYEYLDGELTPETTEEVRRHIELCAGCYPEVKTATEFRDALQRAARGQPLCPDSLRRKVAEMLREEGLSA